MVGTLFASDEAGLAKKLADESGWHSGYSAAELRQRGLVVGVPGEVAEQLQEYAAAGVQRIMLQWLDQDDLVGLEALAQVVL